MIVLIVVASFLLASISIIQFKTEAKEYHQERLERKENAVKEHINYVLSTTTYPLKTANLDLIFKDKIHELAQIHKIEINIYKNKVAFMNYADNMSILIDSKPIADAMRQTYELSWIGAKSLNINK